MLAQPEASLNGLGPQLAITLGFAQRYAWQTTEAGATFEQLIAQIKAPGGENVDDSQRPIMLALAYAGAGQQKAALDHARRAVRALSQRCDQSASRRTRTRPGAGTEWRSRGGDRGA